MVYRDKLHTTRNVNPIKGMDCHVTLDSLRQAPNISQYKEITPPKPNPPTKAQPTQQKIQKKSLRG